MPGGTYSVVAGGRNMLDMGTAGWGVTRVEDIRVSESSPGFTVRVEVERAGEVSGTVTDLGGQPLNGVGVWAMDSRGVWLSTFSEVSTDVGGRYVLDSLDEGGWTLAFRDGTHALKMVGGVNVRIGEVTTLDVVLEPGISLELALAGHDPADIDVTLVGPEGPVPTDLFSMFELLSLGDLTEVKSLGTFPPGLYHVTVTEGGLVLLDTDITLTLGTGGTTVIQLDP
ncbi:MAG: carboxypeptidase-like regulatory domain-containing protein [Planctomycetota bacterium]